ncbi:hypothetical protein [uncultured Sulfitobacter sp.]|jgi:hypothetical protein|uniref:hypothetical protein n=1 Tax=uncultured Sulfitobacter sp. TaxID=191468 RepID=UPI0025962E96|nr:hypothetical protein [uncultured Sulfitobacter sp.]
MIDLMTAADRRAACEELFLESHDWDYAQWLQELTMQSLEQIEDLMGPALSAVPLRQLVQPIAEVGYPKVETWREAMDDVSAFFDVLPMSGRFRDAVLYGHYGVTPAEIPGEERAVWLQELVSDVTAFAARSDVAHLNEGENALVRIAGLARSRLAIDSGEGEVDIHSMAVLGGITEGRVRNLLSDANSKLERGANGGIKAMSAAAWLQKKKGFLPSIWHEADKSVEPQNEGAAVAPERIIFVPVARDGSMFTPDLLRNGVYRIGAKGAEEDVTDFSSALARLNAMPVPRWRRPNENGLWGIVSGVTWQRIEKK